MGRIENLYKKYTKKKVYFAFAILIIIIHIIILTIVGQAKISLSIEGQKLKYASEDGNKIFFKDRDGTLLTVDIKIRGNKPNLIGEKYEIKYKDKFIVVDNSHWPTEGATITLSNGEIYKKGLMPIEYAKQSYIETPSDVGLVEDIYSAYSFAKGDSVYTLLFMTIPGIFYSLASIMYPNKMWRIGHIFTVSGGEPTEWAISSSKIGGTILLMAILITPLFTLMK